jgi:MFS family permease
MPKRASAVIIAGFFTLFIAYAVRYGYGMLLPEMLPALSISKAEAGVVYSSYFIAYTIFSPILGVLADRYNVRTILTVFVALLGIGAFLMSFATSVLNASLFFTLSGIGHSACWVPVVALIQRWVSDRRRGMVLAFTDLGSGLGIAVWSLILPVIVAAYDWRRGWVSLGIMAFMVAGLNYLSVRSPTPGQLSPRGSETDKPLTEPFRKTYVKLFLDAQFWLIGISYLLLSFVVLIIYTFLTTYAVEELQAPYENATRLIALLALVGIFSKLALGTLSDTLGRIRVMMICCALLALGSLGMAYSKRFFTLTLTTILFGLGYGAIWPVYAAAARDYFHRNVAGSVVGLWTLLLGIGSIISPILSGWAIDTTGTYASAFFLALAASVIALILLLPIPNRAYAGVDAYHD